MDYEPLPAVKQYTLDAKLKDLMDLPDHNAQKNAQPGSSTDLENKLDGEIQTGLRKFSLLINYFSFLFRVSFIQSQNYFLDTASAYTVERLD